MEAFAPIKVPTENENLPMGCLSGLGESGEGGRRVDDDADAGGFLHAPTVSFQVQYLIKPAFFLFQYCLGCSWAHLC